MSKCDGSIDDPTTLAYDLANSPFNGLPHHPLKHLVSWLDESVLTQIIAHFEPNEKAAYHYFRFNDPDSFDFQSLYNEQADKKARVGALLKEVATNEFHGYDMACSWTPLKGLMVSGVLFERQPGSRPQVPLTDEEDAIELATLSAFRSWEQIKDYEPGKTVWMGTPDKRSTRGKAAAQRIEELNTQVSGPIEVNDFFAVAFGVFGAAGSTVVDGRRLLAAPRFYHTALGLFMRLPSERMYDVPAGWNGINQTAFVYSQEMQEIYETRNKEDEV